METLIKNKLKKNFAVLKERIELTKFIKKHIKIIQKNLTKTSSLVNTFSFMSLPSRHNRRNEWVVILKIACKNIHFMSQII